MSIYWIDPIGGLGTALTHASVTGVDTAATQSEIIPFPLPKEYVAIYATSSATLSAAASFDLQGSYDGTNYVTLVSDVISSSNLASAQFGSVDLGQYPALKYRIQMTTAGDETAKTVTFYVIFFKES